MDGGGRAGRGKLFCDVLSACGRSRAHAREPGRIQGGCPACLALLILCPPSSHLPPRFCALQFMNNDYVGEQKGRCSNYGFDKNEVHHAWLRLRSICLWCGGRAWRCGRQEAVSDECLSWCTAQVLGICKTREPVCTSCHGGPDSTLSVRPHDAFVGASTAVAAVEASLEEPTHTQARSTTNVMHG